MSSDSGDRRSTKPTSLGVTPPEAEQQLPCPRCDSTNTKFCYYNNYNLSQPRHFCKSCRRYWTQGGTLRNIPIGGGTRKNAKRSRTTTNTNIHTHTPTTATTSSSSNTTSSVSTTPISATPVSSSPPVMESDPLLPLLHDVDLNAVSVSSGGLGMSMGMGMGLGFTSLLQGGGGCGGNQGFLALGGFGLGIGSGFDDLGSFEIGRGVWPSLGGIEESGGAHSVVNGNGGGGATWQIGNGGDGGFGDASDCFGWPELAISTPRKGVK